jgi:hypothetical protein
VFRMFLQFLGFVGFHGQMSSSHLNLRGWGIDCRFKTYLTTRWELQAKS